MSRVSTKFIAPKAVTNPKLADMVTSTVKARVTAGTGEPEDVSLSSFQAALPNQLDSTESAIVKWSVLTRYDAGAPTANALTINWNNSPQQTINLNADITSLTLSNPRNHRVHVLYITASAGGETITWPGSVNWGVAGAPPLDDSGASEQFIVTLVYDSTEYLGLWNRGY